LALLCTVLAACAVSPPPASAEPVSAEAAAPSGADELDTAIRETSDYLNKQLPKGNKLMILNVQSEFPALSEYIIDELIANTVNDRVFSVVDRQQLNTIRAELEFQTSGEVDDDTAQALGRMAGAQTIVSGAVSQIGDLYRLRVRALSVQSAQIEGQFNRNIPEGSTVSALVQSRATGYGNAATSPAASSTGSTAASTPAVVVTPAQAQTAADPAVAPEAAPAAPTTYKIGDTGPAGGLVFYDKGSYSDGWQYLEAASRDVAGTAEWGAYREDVGRTNTGRGSGKRNTEIIANYLREHGDMGRAAQLATEYTQGNYADWFLPSKDELNLMYENLKVKSLGSFQNTLYWSSSQASRDVAWVQNFDSGRQWDDQDGAKNRTHTVRLVRQF
jgi:hypothetical protein